MSKRKKRLVEGFWLPSLSVASHGRTTRFILAVCVIAAELTWRPTMAEERDGSRESNSRGSGEQSDCALLLKRHYVPHGQRDRGYNDPYSGTYGDGGGGGGGSDKGYYNDAEPHEVICIKYSDVNEAAREAKHRTNFIRPRGIDDPLPTERDIAPTGELTLETTRIISAKFRLTHDEISNALPLVDVSRTELWDACPAHVKPIPCTVERFRTQDARCNNIKHPSWGVTNTPFVRFLPQVYSNGIDGLRKARDGGDLPNPRAISNFIHRDFDDPSPLLTILVMSWGQFIDHDLTLAAPPRDEQDLDFDCCGVPPEMQHPLCLTIDVSPKDPFYSQFNRRCIEFKRSLAGQRPNCALGPRTHINILSHTVDANFIYGSSDALSARLRAFDRGLMRTWDRFRELGLKPILPPESENPERDCIGRPRNLFCFIAGDERVNEQIHLTVLHTFYVRDHNRFALELGRLNSHWNDERTYQETRHIQAAMIQYIVYHEYLPMALGPEIMQTYNLTLVEDGYWDGYDPDVNFALANSFQAAAFRFGHTFIQGMVRRYNKYHEFLGQTPLRELLQQPFVVYEPGKLDELALGLINTPAQTYDPFITQEVTEHLFQDPEEGFGRDLISINLQRAREHGVPGYNAFREWCGLGRVETFDELEPFLNNGTAMRYSKIYDHPDDIDLWSGGISERIIEGGMIGPTFACVVGRQFQNLRRGDRFWFENPNLPSSFTPEQLREIRTASQARIICANGDDIPTIQRFVLRLAHPVYNPRVRCEELSEPDLSLWKEDPRSGHWPTNSDYYKKKKKK